MSDKKELKLASREKNEEEASITEAYQKIEIKIDEILEALFNKQTAKKKVS